MPIPVGNTLGNSPVYDPAQSMPTSGGPATNMAAGSPAYGQTDQVSLYVGKTPRKPKGPHQSKLYGDSYIDPGSDIRRTPGQLLAEFDQMSRKDFLKFRNLLIAAGLVSESADAPQVRDTYQGLMQEVYELQTVGGRPKLTVGSMVKNLIRLNGLDPSKIGADEDFSTSIEEQLKPSSQTTTSVYDLTPEDARQTLEQAMAQKLGRAPTEEEVEDFISAAQTRADRNPTSITQSFRPGVAGGEGDEVMVEREGGEVVGTTTTNVNQGFDEQAMARMADRRAKNAPDYASYQAVSQYFPALIQAMQATI